MKFEDIKNLPPEIQPVIVELLAVKAVVSRVEEKMEAIMHNQIALNQTIKAYEEKLPPTEVPEDAPTLQ